MPESLRGLLRCLPQLPQGVADLAGGGALRLHPFVHRFEARRQRLHLLYDFRQLPGHLPRFLAPPAHFFIKFIHPHHPCRHSGLHFLDHLLYVIGRHRRLVRQPANLRRHHAEAVPVLPGLLSLDRSVERKQVGLVGHFIDGRHDRINIGRFFVEQGQLGADIRRGFHDLAHGAFQPRQPRLPAARQMSRAFGDAGYFAHGPPQFLGRRGYLLSRRPDFHRGGSHFVGGSLLLFEGGSHFVGTAFNLHQRSHKLAQGSFEGFHNGSRDKDA